MTQPQITVGILSGKEIEFSFPVKFSSSVGTEISGTQKVIYQDGKIHWQGKEYDELSFIPPQNAHAFFELKDVTIGINFHWERKEVQKFKGELKIIIEGEQLTAINVISIEEYLTSVISSEMSATASLELLKAHAVISRSWLVNKLRVENGELRVGCAVRLQSNSELCKKTAQPILHSSFLILHLLSGMTMKHIEISMYVPMIIASVIRELHEPQHHKPSKQSPPRGGKC